MQSLSQENDSDLHENEPGGKTHFQYKWFRTKTRFDTEAKDNSEFIGLLHGQIDSVFLFPFLFGNIGSYNRDL